MRGVFENLRATGLTLNPGKCRFGFDEVVFMGLLIKSGKVLPTEDKVRAITEFPTPINATQVRQFLGLSGFFWRFIPGYASVAAPLASLTSVKVVFQWGDAQATAFENLKRIMREPPVLTLFQPNLAIEVHTDASSAGVAGMLLQPDPDGRLQLVRCVSRKCSRVESAYNSSRLELLAITFTLEKLRAFLIGRDFKLVTDCQTLLSINTQTTRSPQLARWLTLIQDFQFTVEHRGGTRMSHVDAVSRNPSGDPPEDMEKI